MSKKKKALIVIIGIILFFAILMISMTVKTKRALEKQVNVEIAMESVADGDYIGESDGGMVQVKVRVNVQNHKITHIQLLKHDTGLGKPAEAIIDDMIKYNTDDVDAVSGATASSKTIRNAVNKALQQGLQ